MLRPLLATLAIAATASAQCLLDDFTGDSTDVGDAFGWSIAADGSDLAVGALHGLISDTGMGEVYIFKRQGADWIQQAVLMNPVDDADDDFGYSVSMSGGVPAVGAPNYDSPVSNSGRLFVFRWNGAAWQHEDTLYPPTPSSGGQFGWDCVVVGQSLVVGHDGGANEVYVYREVAGAWTLTQVLTPPQGLAQFGNTLAGSGGTLLVGAPASERVHVFVDQAGQWTWAQELAASQGGASGFGRSIAVDGTTAVVGAPFFDPSFGQQNQGGLHVFMYDGASWVHSQLLRPLDLFNNDEFGREVAIYGDHLVVGSHASIEPVPGGAVHFFARVSGQCVQTSRIVNPVTAPLAGDFGHSIALTSGGALVCDHKETALGMIAGRVYAFSTVGDCPPSWDCNSNGVLDAHDIDSGTSQDCDVNGVPDECDWDCDANGVPDACDIAAGDPDCNMNGVPDGCDVLTGASLDCDGNGTPDECDDDCNDNGLADACEILAGATDCDGNGLLDECEISDDPFLDQDLNGALDVCSCTASNYCLAAGNSAGTQALMSASGSPRVSENAFTVSVTGAVPLKFGMFFYGAQQQAVFYGEGMVCIHQPYFRLEPVVLSDAAGNASHQVDFTSLPASSGPGAIGAFSTWNFQYWYRDPLGGPSGFNFSDGLQVTFCP